MVGSGAMGMKRLRQHCAALVNEVDVPDPFDVRELCARLGAARGKPIHLLPQAMPAGGPCGLWVSTDNAEYIVYEERTSAPHREHIILHEIGHLLSDHGAVPVPGEDSTRMVFPSLDPQTVQRVLSRTHYTAVEERQAELIASLLLERVSRRAPESRWTVSREDAGAVERIRRSLGNT
ncbi:hypothetical protein [Kutzneria albida]|uniref:hypothetical protein n=1 Tax=Kutzneria albida TaxID=43357 RepID=UPI00130E3E6B|nr:hypothetical protein [Kutzneria albida]